MEKLSKRLLWKSLLLVEAAVALLALSLLEDNLALGTIAIVLLFLLFRRSLALSMRQRLLAIFLATLSFMTLLTYWFKNIEALGWQNIWILPPQFWLLLAVLVVGAVCAAAVTLLFYLFYKYIDARKVEPSSISFVYLWALVMTFVELLISITFSILARADGAPIEPTWNMYSVALLVASNSAGFLARVFGFWGTSFIIYFVCGLLGLLFVVIRDKNNKQVKKLLVILALILPIILLLAFVKTPAHEGEEIRVVAISQHEDKPDYLEKIKENLLSTSKTTVVVLPEYSNLLSPYANSSGFSLNYDARYTYPKLFSGQSIYFVGTEDQYIQNSRYVENYVVNGSLQKLKRQAKTFLIPGGEYVIGWVGKILQKVDPDSTQLFTSTRSRQVISNPLPVDLEDSFSNKIGIGACSSILIPYHFRQEVADGAEILGVNVSYEQFKKAPEYEQFANRFAQFTAKATSRPIALSARSGNSIIYDMNGATIGFSAEKPLAETLIKLQRFKTPYVVLGDKLILMLLALPALAIILWRIVTERKSTKSKTKDI